MGALTMVLMLMSAGPEWKKLDTIDGIGVFAREVPNESFYELKLVTSSNLSVEKLCDAAYGTAGVDPAERPISSITTRRLIRETRTENGLERITYEQLNPPMVSGRDYAVHAKKELRPDGSCRLTFVAENQYAPPLPNGFVRIEKLRGTWDFVSVNGATRATYTIFTDPNVSLPASFIQGSMQKTAVYWVQLILRRAQHSIVDARASLP